MSRCCTWGNCIVWKISKSHWSLAYCPLHSVFPSIEPQERLLWIKFAVKLELAQKGVCSSWELTAVYWESSWRACLVNVLLRPSTVSWFQHEIRLAGIAQGGPELRAITKYCSKRVIVHGKEPVKWCRVDWTPWNQEQKRFFCSSTWLWYKIGTAVHDDRDGNMNFKVDWVLLTYWPVYCFVWQLQYPILSY